MDTAMTGTAGRASREAAALRAALARYKVDERSDGTEFRRKARLLASLWREANGLAPGTYHPPPRAGIPSREPWAAVSTLTRPGRGRTS
jgi:hypothetical protein